MSTIVTSDTAGAVTLPAELWQAVGVEPGTELVAEVAEGRIVLQPPESSIADDILALANALPPGTLDDLPEDGAAQLDHYLYGSPKRPE